MVSTTSLFTLHVVVMTLNGDCMATSSVVPTASKEVVGPISDHKNIFIDFALPYTGSLHTFTGVAQVLSTCVRLLTNMVKGQSGKHQGMEKGKQKLPTHSVGPSKRGKKTKKEVMENIFDIYSTGNPPQVRNIIQG